MLMKTKAPNPVDVQVGARIRLVRTARGMSQEKLGEALGISFQQIQKYEKGTNRVGASRMSAIAAALGKPVAYFFEDTPEATYEPDEMSLFVQSPECTRLIKAFTGLKTPAYRAAVIATIATLTKCERGEA